MSGLGRAVGTDGARRWPVAVAAGFAIALAGAVASTRSAVVQFGVPAVIACLGLVFVAPAAVPSLLIFARSVADIGAPSGSSFLPSGAISGGLAVGAIALLLVRYFRTALKKWGLPAGLVVVVVVAWWLRAADAFGADPQLVGEAVRILSIAAIFLFAANSFKVQTPRRAVNLVLVSTLPATLITLMGFIANVPQLVGVDGRASGPFSHANSAAAFLAVATTATFVAALRFQSRWLWGYLCIVSAALFSTQSLGAVAATGVGIAVGVTGSSAISGPRKAALGLSAIAAGSTVGIMTGAVNRLTELSTTQSFAAAAQGGTTNSLDWRFYNWALLFDLWQEKPWFGYGLGATSTYVQPAGNLPHSVPVQLLTELGVFGFFLVTVIFSMFARRISAASRENGWQTATMWALLATAGVHAVESNYLGYTAAMYLLMGCLASLMASRGVAVGSAMANEGDAALRTSRR